jgi:hypothetical protein
MNESNKDPNDESDAAKKNKKPPLSPKTAFGIGALGGVAPVLVRGAVYLFAHDGVMPPLKSGQLLGYMCAVAIFLVFGGVVAIALDDARTIKSAFLVGVSLPSLFQVSGLQADAPRQTADVSAPFHVAFISSAWAEEQEGAASREIGSRKTSEDAPVSYRKLEVSTPNTPISNNVSATFLDNSGNRISSTTIQPGFAAVNVPAKAAAVQFQKDGSATESHALSNTAVQTADVKIEQKPVSAFVQAIGLSREAKPSLEVTKVADAQKLPVATYGWCYLGERGPDNWRNQNVDFAGQDVPQKGSVVTVNSPLTVRPAAESSDVIGVAHAGQRLRIEEVKNRDNLYWAAVTVVD